MTLLEARVALAGLSAYKFLLKDPVLAACRALLDALAVKDGPGALDAYTDVFCRLREGGFLGLGDWLWDALRYSDSPYPRLLIGGGTDPALEGAAQRDVESLILLAGMDCQLMLDALAPLLSAACQATLAALPRWTAGTGFTFSDLREFYLTHGCGQFARYRAFRWGPDGLTPIPEPDSPAPWELLGYESQRRAVVDNARALLEGRRVNHVLLYGESGTGKSASVKSLLSLPGFEALRIVELRRDSLGDIPALVRILEREPQKFILFLDDLAFDQDDDTYSQLKTILEGSLEKRRDNIAVYATSNRRNLVRQTFSDRLSDDVDVAETIAEKTSLADRFGLRIPYPALTPGEYLEMVRQMARLYRLDMSPDELDAAARQWLLRHPGRTPRTARQFIAQQLA